jgi:hypothetical protein
VEVVGIGQILGIVLAALVAALFYSWVSGRLPKRGERYGDAAFLGKLLASVMIFALIAAQFSPQIGELFGIRRAPEAVGPVVIPPEYTVAERMGYVIASVEDAYRIPRTLLENASVYVSVTQPVAGSPWVAVAAGRTGASGSTMIQVPGVTSGMVYVTGYIENYYAASVATTIPGAQVMPSPAQIASIRLPAIGTLSITVSENSSNITYDPSTGYITENTTMATSGYFTLTLATSGAFTALRNLRLLEVRGDAFDTLGAAIAPVVVRDGGTSPSASGDPTLSSAISGGWDFVGDLQYGQMIQIRYTVAVASAGQGTIARIHIDDLLGALGLAGEPGIEETVLYIRAVQ